MLWLLSRSSTVIQETVLDISLLPRKRECRHPVGIYIYIEIDR